MQVIDGSFRNLGVPSQTGIGRADSGLDHIGGRWERGIPDAGRRADSGHVFVIQHTQARQQAATQRKLDEILQAMPGADNSLLTLEHASDDELRATGDLHRGIRQAALGEQRGSPGAERLTAASNAQDN